ncbi:MAG: ASCH domain protein [bacterium]|nr:ASCH domain protein [bacterium]MDE0353733.1 ASCH domain protein [bacterium]
MDKEQAGRCVLMSIKPRFAHAILDGSKKVEFRKRRLANDIQKAYVYVTAPVKAVQGEFDVENQVVGTPEELWARFAGVAGIDRQDFFDYFSTTTRGVGIGVGAVTCYTEPVPLEVLDPGGRAPQSVKYLSAVPGVPRR